MKGIIIRLVDLRAERTYINIHRMIVYELEIIQISKWINANFRTQYPTIDHFIYAIESARALRCVYVLAFLRHHQAHILVDSNKPTLQHRSVSYMQSVKALQLELDLKLQHY